MNPNFNNIHNKFLDSGFNAMPVGSYQMRKNTDGQWERVLKDGEPIWSAKKPCGKWKHLETEVNKRNVDYSQYEQGDNGEPVELGVLTGVTSCPKEDWALEVLDIDMKNDPTKEILREITDSIKERLPHIYDKLVVITTPSGGQHFLYYTKVIEGNLKLALSKDGEDIIETRGQGGYIKSFPSKGYSVYKGKFSEVPYITDDERDAIMELSRSLDRTEVVAQQMPTPKTYTNTNDSNGDISPFDDFTQKNSIADVLSEHGWSFPFGETPDGDGRIHVLRPGAPTSVHSGNIKDGVLILFSSKGGFETEKGYNVVQVWMTLNNYGLEHDGYSRASKELINQGYGRYTPETIDRPVPSIKDNNTNGLRFDFSNYEVSKTGVSQIPNTDLINIIAKNYAFMRGAGYFFPIDAEGNVDFSEPMDAAYFVAAIRDLGKLSKANVEAALASKKIKLISAVEIMYQFLNQNKWDGKDRMMDFVKSMNLQGDFEKNHRLIKKFLTMSLAFSLRNIDPALKYKNVDHRICMALVSLSKGWGKTTALRKLGLDGKVRRMIKELSKVDINIDLYNELPGNLPKDATSRALLATNGMFINLDDVDTALLNAGGEMRSLVSSKTIPFRPLFSNQMEYVDRTAVYMITSNNETLLRDKSEDRYMVFTLDGPTDQELLNGIDMMQLWAQLHAIIQEGDEELYNFGAGERAEVRGMAQDHIWSSGFEDWVQQNYTYNPKATTPWEQIVKQIKAHNDGVYHKVSEREIAKSLQQITPEGQSSKRRATVDGVRSTYWNFDYALPYTEIGGSNTLDW